MRRWPDPTSNTKKLTLNILAQLMCVSPNRLRPRCAPSARVKSPSILTTAISEFLSPSAHAAVRTLISHGRADRGNIVGLLPTSKLKNLRFASVPSREVESGRPHPAACRSHSSDWSLNEKPILSIASVFLVPLRWKNNNTLSENVPCGVEQSSVPQRTFLLRLSLERISSNPVFGFITAPSNVSFPEKGDWGGSAA